MSIHNRGQLIQNSFLPSITTVFAAAQNALALLHQRGLLVSSDFDQGAVRRQMNGYDSLLKKSRQDHAINDFLAEYDALMRLIEVILIFSGFRLVDEPHRVLKDVIDAIIPKSGIHNVCDARHQAKKLSIEPSTEMRSQLASIRSRVEAAILQNRRQVLDD